MNDIGLHPDAGRPEPPDHPPITISARLIVEVEVAVYGDPEEGYGDLRMNLEDIANRGHDEGLVTFPGDSEMEVVSFEAHVERM